MNPGNISMSHKEINRLEVMERLKTKQLKQREASHLLNLSVRQIKRLWSNYKQLGTLGLISKKRGKPSNHQLPEDTKAIALKLIQEKYADFGPTLAQEKLAECHQLKLSVETVRQIMMAGALWKAKNCKPKAIHQQRQRRSCFGELVQIDGSPHDWFEGRAEKCTLLVSIDDATSRLLSLRFEPCETTFGYFRLVQDYIKAYGCPAAFYSDKHSIFRVNIKEAESGTGETQFSRAMKQLDIALITANSPQAKGRVERANKTLQDRLIKEMRLRNINSMEEANAYLPEFMDDFNQRFAKPPKCDTNAHRELTFDDEALGHILSLQSNRILSKNLECSYNNAIYQIQAQDRKNRLQHTTINVCENMDGHITLFYKDSKLDYKVFDKQNQPRLIVDDKTLDAAVDNVIKKSPKPHKPRQDNPWRNFVINPRKVQQAAM